MKKSRKQYTAKEKVTILRRHLLDGTAVSDICDQLNLQPTVFYRWQKQFFENGTAAFEKKGSSKPSVTDKKIAALEDKLNRKHEVLSELMEEHVKLKKALGEL